MKRMMAFLLTLALLLTGCGQRRAQPGTAIEDSAAAQTAQPALWEDYEPRYTSLSDDRLLAHIEDLVYRDTVVSLNSDEYFVENVTATYVSREYLEEAAFNSQANIYFGYTLAELDELFQGKKYIFTLGDDGTTQVQEFQQFQGDPTETMLRNVAIGAGVILICVTVSAVTAGAGAPAVSMIFAASAKSATTFALSSAAFGGISAGVVKGVETGDFNEALETAAQGASEGFMWGAIGGAIGGGGKQAFMLKSATRNGLTMNQAALIQKESKYPLDVISEMKSMEEYNVYKEAGLKTVMVNERTALVPDIDLEYVSKRPDGTEVSNLWRMQHKLAPIDPATGKSYQLHHIGQKADATLAVLTEDQHLGNSSILNKWGKETEIDRKAFDKIRKEFWGYLGNVVFASGGI